MRRLHGLLRAAKEAEAERSLPRPAMAAAAARAAQLAPHEAELDAELDEAAEVSSSGFGSFGLPASCTAVPCGAIRCAV